MRPGRGKGPRRAADAWRFRRPTRTAVSLRVAMVTAKSAGRDGIIEHVSAAELGVRIENNGGLGRD
jgi:hypothetical protein